MITLTSFQLKWLERLVLYHINEDNNVQAKLSALQYGFRAGVSTETALPEFVRCVEHCLVGKKPALGIFLDIVGAFDNVTFRSFVATLRGLGMSKILYRLKFYKINKGMSKINKINKGMSKIL